MSRLLIPAACLLAFLLGFAANSRGEELRFEASFPADVRGEPATGRLLVYLVREGSGPWRRPPAHGPFFDDPQPMFAVDVVELAPGRPAVVDDEADSFPASLSRLPAGRYRAQAVLDIQRRSSSWRHEPGNLFSDVVTFEWQPGTALRVELPLSNVVRERRFPQHEMLREVVVESRLLSEFRGERVVLRAGVVLPIDFVEGREYPAVYVVPGFGGDHFGAATYLRRRRGQEDDPESPRRWDELRRHAFIVVLDPESPNGHTLFCDSAVNGPWGEALVSELIPGLEAEFPLIAEPTARIISGHSSGGWSSLWLALNYPETFGACWSTGPDPVDFRRFQLVNLYEDESFFEDEDGEPVASYRQFDEEGRETVGMTIAQEVAMEEVMGPGFSSGQQWASWLACWARPRADRPDVPRAVFDPETGEIDHGEVEFLRRYDIRLMISRDPERLVPLFAQRVRLICGEDDNYYLNLAVALLKEELAGHDASAAERVILVPGADHGATLFESEEARAIPQQMLEHLRDAGLTRDE